MKKRILSALMACILMLSLIPTFSLHAEAAASNQAKDVVAAATSYASSGKSIGVMCAGMVCKAAKEAGVTSSQMNLKATIASPFVGTNQFGYIDSSGNLKYGCNAYTWKDFADGNYTPKTGDLVFYGYMKSGGGTASKTVKQVAKSGDYYHTHVGIIRNDNSTMSKLYTVDGGQNSSSDTSHYTYVKTKDRKISDTSTGYAWTSSGKKIYVMEFVRPNYEKDAEVTVSKTVACPARITIQAAAPLYRSATTDTVTDAAWDKYSSETTVSADGYVDLSNSQRRYYFVAQNGKTGEYLTYYVPTSSLNSIEAIHDYRAPNVAHPHYKTCVCGDQQPTVDEYCYECCPSYIYYSPGDGSLIQQNITTGRYPYTVITRASWDLEREGYTLLGWSLDPDAVTPTYSNVEETITLLPGKSLHFYAIWKENAHVHTMEYHARQDAACLNDGTAEYWFCTGCGNYYLDADGSTETTADEIVLPALGHNYSNGTCTRCGAADPDFVVSGSRYQISDAGGSPGQTVKVTVSIADNPGIIALRQSIVYDMSVLELTGVKNLGLLAGYTEPSPTVSSPYTLRWADSLATKNNTKNGAIAELTFRIKDTAKEGTYTIRVNHLEARNANGSKLSFANAAAQVTVRDFIAGDLDGDGEVTDWDGILLNRYLAGWTVTLNTAAADTDGDGEVSVWDGILLNRYLAGWQVTLGK